MPQDRAELGIVSAPGFVMARMSRLVIPGLPHHVTQRGNRRLPTFFRGGDYVEYLKLLKKYSENFQVKIWAYCLMTNHVHFIAIPFAEDGLRKMFGEVHRHYTRFINFREGWRGHLWQGRFFSFPIQENRLLSVAKYIERNPVASGIVGKPEDYEWSSTRENIWPSGKSYFPVSPLVTQVENWREFINEPSSKELVSEIHLHERTGRPWGEKEYLKKLEVITGRNLLPKRAGRKPKKIGMVSPDYLVL